MEQRRLAIGQHLLQRVLEHCLDEKPFEACGIMTGRDGTVLHVYATANAKRSPVFYEVDPVQQEQVLREMTHRGDQLIAIYHSHPTTAAEPSVNDIRLAVHWPDALRVIISLVGPSDMRAFLIQPGQVTNVPIATLHDLPGEWHDLRAAPEKGEQ